MIGGLNHAVSVFVFQPLPALYMYIHVQYVHVYDMYMYMYMYVIYTLLVNCRHLYIACIFIDRSKPLILSL